MKVQFHFEDVGANSFGHIYRPIASVQFHSLDQKVWVEVWMIVDTGADFTILPRHFSQKLRVSLEKDCKEDVTIGVGGEQRIYFLKKKLQVKIGSLEREVPLAFSESNEIPALLGRLGFMETFDTEFLKSHIVVFKS